MKDDIKSKLNAVLDKHEAATRAAAEARQATENKEQAFIHEFSRVRDTVIRPAMEEIGNHVSGRGISFRISSQDEVPPDPHRGGGQDASISITFFPGEQTYPEYEFPGSSVFAKKYNQRVMFHERTMMPGRGGMSGSSGEAILAELSAELIQTKVLDVLGKAFS